MCRCCRILFNYKLSLSLLGKFSNLVFKGCFGKVGYVLNIDIEEVCINTFSNFLLCHLHCNVKHIVSVKQTGASHMTHAKRLTNTCPSKSDIKSLVRKTTFRNFVKILKVKRNTIFLAVVRLIAFLIIIKVVMTNVVVKRYC